jgi:nucleoid-associated protein YgaU
VREAIGTGAAETPMAVQTLPSAVTVENRAGRPLLNVRVAIDAKGVLAPFVRTIPSIETGQTMTLALTDFRTEEGVALDSAATAPTQVTVRARDTLTNSYEVTARWD